MPRRLAAGLTIRGWRPPREGNVGPEVASLSCPRGLLAKDSRVDWTLDGIGLDEIMFSINLSVTMSDQSAIRTEGTSLSLSSRLALGRSNGI